jgi:hypothetical protein
MAPPNFIKRAEANRRFEDFYLFKVDLQRRSTEPEPTHPLSNPRFSHLWRSRMADLALAISGVVSTGVTLTSAVASFYKSAYKAPQEVKEIESDLRLLHPVLLQVEEVFGNPDYGCSERAERDLRGILEHCQQIFADIENLLVPYQKPDGTFQVGLG